MVLGVVNEKALSELGWPALRAELARRARTPMGRERCAALVPGDAPAEELQQPRAVRGDPLVAQNRLGDGEIGIGGEDRSGANDAQDRQEDAWAEHSEDSARRGRRTSVA